MELSSINPSLAAELLRAGDASAPASATAEKPAAGEPAGSASDAFREVLAQYNVTNISPREFSELIQKLNSTGAIDEEQLRELSLIRIDLDAARVDADEQVDLLEFYAERLQEQHSELERLADRAKKTPQITRDIQAALEQTQSKLAWLQKFAHVQSGAAPEGLDVSV